MPEGPEIWRAAGHIAKALGSGPLVEVVVGLRHLESAEYELVGTRVESVRPRGKALLTSFSNGQTLYSHNQLYGVWRVARSVDRLRATTRALRVRLTTAHGTAALYSATDVELWSTAEIDQHPFLMRVGPDVLDPDLDLDAVHSRLQSFPRRRARLGALLLDQAFFCGVGNYLRAEILWTAKIHPARTLASLGDDDRDALARALLEVPRASLMYRHARGERRFTFAVFGREGAPCPRCDDAIGRVDDAGRRMYFCARCQPPLPVGVPITPRARR